MSEDTTSHGKRAGFDRRDVLKGFAGAAAVASLSAQGFRPDRTKEAPALAKLAADGKLPPLAERIPANPLVIAVEKVGSYGGSLRRGLRGSSDHNGILRMVGNQGLVRWNLAFTEVLPNVAEKWEVNAELDRIHLLPPQGDEMVGRQALHRRRHRLLDRGLRQEHRALQVASQLRSSSAASRAPSPRSTTATVKFTFAGPYALFLETDGDAARPAPDAVRQALLQPVPPEVQPGRWRISSRRPTCPTGARCSAPSAATSRFPRAGATRTSRRSTRGWSRKPIPAARRASSMERNPYFWQVDQRRQPASLYRPADLQHLAGRRVADARRDLRPPGHPGAPHRHAAEQADAVAEHAEGRLPPDRARSTPARSRFRST